MSLAEESRTMVFYESPHRLVKTLQQCAEYFGEDRRAAVCRELSKVHEEIRRGTVAELLAWYLENDPRGEIVLVVEGKKES
jgi:16S rRNA (cytidine1402-2'-O)-methyltransferase